jgi:NADPH:quinone reductase-like Zn-dependent oxidoreductase
MANQAWQITSPGNLILKDLGPPSAPGPKEILVRIHAFALNYRDILNVDHDPDYPLTPKQDLIPGSDGAGIVEAAGSDSRWKQGDRVVIHPNTWMSGDPRNYIFDQTRGGASLDGTFQRFLLVDEEFAFKAPDGMTLLEASTLFTAGVTAWNVLNYGDPKLGPGDTVLTQGTGGVSCYAVQVSLFETLPSSSAGLLTIQRIAAAAGATVIATSSSDEKLELARKLGATHLINYNKTPDWSSKAFELTGGVGVDLVVEVVGGAGLAHSINSLRYGGRIGLVGILDKEDAPIAPTKPLLFGSKTSKCRVVIFQAVNSFRNQD